MPASAPSPPSAQPPPDLPNIPGMSPVFADYLRRFALWCRNGFADRLSINTSIPYVHMLSPAGNTFKVSSNDSGILLSTPIIPGGAESTPILNFMPVVTGNQGGHSSLGTPGGITSTDYKMLGVGNVSSFTPQGEFAAVAHATGMVANSVVGSVTTLAFMYGTGTAPTHGAAAVGTIIGGATSIIATSTTAAPFTLTQVASGLALSTAYWFDVGVKSTGGTVTISQFGLLVDGVA